MSILHGCCIEILKTLKEKSIHSCVTSPPYFGLRDYGTQGQIGLETTPEEYISKILAVFSQVKRVLRDDGTLWLNLGDSYWNNFGGGSSTMTTGNSQAVKTRGRSNKPKHSYLKIKDLIGIPWLVALALQKDGWYLRQDIIWCLSGGTYVYARTQKGETPMPIRDMSKLDPSTVQLWNGNKWTQVKGFSKSKRRGNEIEFVLRSGERISCTPTHKFPTNRGLLEAKNIAIGDCFEFTSIPEPNNPKDTKFINEDIAWFIGLYIAEGSKSLRTIQISGHSKEQQRWIKLKKIAKEYGGSITRTIDGNKMDIRLYGKILFSFIDEFVSGKTAKNKCLSPSCWKYSNTFLKAILDGYLSGDGHWDKKNNRWRIGFTRNYNLERDLRVLSARLGFNLTLNISNSFIGDKKYPSFIGEIRFEKSQHFNRKNKTEVVKIQKARCREVYDIGVEDEPHLFSLASGILTHNSKPNALPESVTDRCSKSHEYIFLLSKSPKYYFDNKSIKVPMSANSTPSKSVRGKNPSSNAPIGQPNQLGSGSRGCDDGLVNKRSVWTVTTKPFKDAHFATFPIDLIEPCILAGCPENGTVLDPFFGAGTTGIVCIKNKRNYLGIELNQDYIDIAKKRISDFTT